MITSHLAFDDASCNPAPKIPPELSAFVQFAPDARSSDTYRSLGPSWWYPMCQGDVVEPERQEEDERGDQFRDRSRSLTKHDKQSREP